MNLGYHDRSNVARPPGTWDIENVLLTATTNNQEQEMPVLTDSISCVEEKNPDAPSGIGGFSDGFYCWMDDNRWILFGHRGMARRATFIFQYVGLSFTKITLDTC